MKTISKARFFLNLEKEEQWLNSMSRQGWHLIRVSYFNKYTFELGEPQSRNYRIDCHTFQKRSDLNDYLTLFANSGWASVDPRLYRSNYYFYELNNNAHRDIFSDGLSKSQRYLRLSQAFFYSGVVSLLPYTALYATGLLSFSSAFYLTPNLWNMPFREFIVPFLIETPFVLFRLAGRLLPILLLLAFAYFAVRLYVRYKKDSKA